MDYETIVIALFLIEESYKTNSFWRPYIENLPADYSNLPIYFDDNELELLKNYNLYDDVIKQRKNLKKYYNEFICVAANQAKLSFSNNYCKDISFGTFLWTFITVKNRIFYFNRNGLEEMALSPLADMINHDTKSILNWRYSSNYNGFIIYSTGDHNYGQEVFINYGMGDTETIFKFYGFIPEQSPRDLIYLKVSLDVNDKQYHLKFSIFKKLLLKSTQTICISNDMNFIKTIEFLNFFRFISYEDNLLTYVKIYFKFYKKKKEKMKQKKNNKKNNKKKNSISKESNESNASSASQNKTNLFNKDVLSVDYVFNNEDDDEVFKFNPKKFSAADIVEEVKMLKKLKILINDKLESFQDNHIMEETKVVYDLNKEILPKNERNIYLYKIRQKNILYFYDLFCDEMIIMLKMNLKEFEKYYAKYYERLKPYKSYIENTVMFLLTVYN